MFSLVLLLACDDSSRKEIKQKTLTKNPDHEDTLLPQQNAMDARADSSGAPAGISGTKKKVRSVEEAELLVGISRDHQINSGEPIVQQLVLPKSTLVNFPDTLKKLALSNYRSYEDIFPRAVADDFEKGKSKEIISYPEKLVFRFELFEKEKAIRPYKLETLTIRRSANGELRVE